MDISRANSEPFHLFHRFNERFNRNMRIAVGALGLVTEVKSRKPVGKVLKLPTLGEPWGRHTLWKDVAKEIPDTKRFLTQIGIVRVFSAFEDFSIGMKGEFDRNARLKGLETSRSSAQDLPALYQEMGWDEQVLKSAIPLFDYFVVVRNCIAHQSGRANSTLVAIDASPELRRCLHGWQSKRNKKPPPLPLITIGKEIPLLPRHAILAAEVCYRIASDLNSKLRHSLGPDGFVYMAVHHALLSEDRIPTDARKSPESLINIVLTGRYRIDVETGTEVIAILRSISQWDACRKAFERLFPSPKAKGPIKRC